jgi:hypothetical protein
LFGLNVSFVVLSFLLLPLGKFAIDDGRVAFGGVLVGGGSGRLPA